MEKVEVAFPGFKAFAEAYGWGDVSDDPTGWLIEELRFRRDYFTPLQESLRAFIGSIRLDPAVGRGGTLAEMAKAAGPLHKALDALIEGRPAVNPAYEQDVAGEQYRLQVREDAKRRRDEEMNPPATLPPVRSLTEFLAEPDDETPFRIEQLAPTNGRILLASQYKAGKTTLLGNLMRSLADKSPFLGRFQVNIPAERIVLIDNEMDEGMVRRWLRDQGIDNTCAVADVVTLRGNVRAFNLLDDRVRGQWARRLGDLGCDYLMLDCLRPILDALGLDENHQTGRFLEPFDALMAEAGINDAAIAHHMGHAGERARGDSRLQDWPDATWRLVRLNDEPDSPRYFSAYGRDVDVPNGRLDFDPDTRRLTYTDESRASTRQRTDVEAVLLVEKLRAGDGDGEMNRNAILEEAHRKHHRGDKTVGPALLQGVLTSVLSVRDGPRKSKIYRLTNPCSDCFRPVEELFSHIHPECAEKR